MKKEVGITVLLVILCVLVGVKNPQFISAANLENTSRLIGIYGIFSIGAGLVIITGGIDLSVGSLFALQGVLLAMMLHERHWPWGVGVGAIIGGSLLLGWLHGFLITKVKLQPFIVTLCGLLFYRGIARYIAGDETKGFGSGGYEFLRGLAGGNLGPQRVMPSHAGFLEYIWNLPAVIIGHVPMPFVLLLVVAAVMWVVVHRTVYGRYLFAVGRNEAAIRYSGINTDRVVASAYIVGLGLSAISGIVLAFYTNSVSPSTHGNAYELYGIAAAVLGGCSLRGGEGSIIGILLGTTLLRVLYNLVIMLNIPSSLEYAVIGAVILLGVMVDQFVAARRQKLKKVDVLEPPQGVPGGIEAG